MKPNHQSLWFRAEYGIAAAILLSACGQFLIVGASGLAWCVVRAVRPGAPALLAVAASIFAASMVLAVVDLVAGHGSVAGSIEIFLAGTVALVLLFRRANLWAYLLIAHSLFVIIMGVFSLRQSDWAAVPARMAFGAVVLNVFLILLLVEHLRTVRPAVSPAAPTSHENG
jgi:hypothetical protein